MHAVAKYFKSAAAIFDYNNAQNIMSAMTSHTPWWINCAPLSNLMSHYFIQHCTVVLVSYNLCSVIIDLWLFVC